MQELLQVDVSSSVTTVEELPSLNLAGLKIAAEKKYEVKSGFSCSSKSLGPYESLMAPQL